MSGRSLPLLALVALLLVVGVGIAFVTGVFGGDSDAGAEAGLVTENPGDSFAPRPETSDPLSNAIPIETSTFTGEGPFSGRVIARASVEDTGLHILGDIKNLAGHPVEGAVVTLFAEGIPNGFGDLEQNTVAVLKTDGAALFAFTNILDGQVYRLTVSHPDYQLARRGPIRTQQATTLEQSIVMSEGVALAGRVTDSGGIPLADVEVSVVNLALRNDGTQDVDVERSVRTRADGLYEIKNLAVGRKQVLARKKGFATASKSPLELSLKEGNQSGVDFTLDAGLSIVGLVLDVDSGEPIANATVSARALRLLGAEWEIPSDPRDIPVRSPREAPTSSSGETGDEGEVGPGTEPTTRARIHPKLVEARQRLATLAEESTTTDERGEFRLEGVANAEYILRARASGYQPSAATRANAGDFDVKVQARRGPRIRGRVIDATTGNPPEVPVTLATTPNEAAGIRTARNRQVFQSKNGEFEYQAERPGRMVLMAIAEGYAGGKSSLLTLNIGQDLDDVLIRIVRGGSITGRALDHAGQPVAGASVRVAEHATGAENLFITRIMEMAGGAGPSTTTGADGTFEVKAIKPGRYAVTLSHSRFAEIKSEPVEVIDGQNSTTGDIRMPRGAALEGFVRSKEGELLPGASVTIAGTDMTKPFSRQAVTDKNGRYRLSGVPEGSYRVTVIRHMDKPDFADIILQAREQNIVNLSDGETKQLDL